MTRVGHVLHRPCCRLQRLLVIVGVMGTLSACDGQQPLDDAKVDPSSIWVDYRSAWDESTDQVDLGLQFRLRDGQGRPIKLGRDSRVSLPSEGLSFSEVGQTGFGFDGTSYVASLKVKPPVGAVLAAPAPDGTVAETSAKSKVREQSYRVLWLRRDGAEIAADLIVTASPRIATEGFSATVRRSFGFAVRFVTEDMSGRGSFDKEEIRCELRTLTAVSAPQPAPTPSATPASGGVIGTPFPVPTPTASPEPVRGAAAPGERNGGCYFSAEALENFTIGAAQVIVVSEQDRPLPAALGGRGSARSRSSAPPVWVTVTE